MCVCVCVCPLWVCVFVPSLGVCVCVCVCVLSLGVCVCVCVCVCWRSLKAARAGGHLATQSRLLVHPEFGMGGMAAEADRDSCRSLSWKHLEISNIHNVDMTWFTPTQHKVNVCVCVCVCEREREKTLTERET